MEGVTVGNAPDNCAVKARTRDIASRSNGSVEASRGCGALISLAMRAGRFEVLFRCGERRYYQDYPYFVSKEGESQRVRQIGYNQVWLHREGKARQRGYDKRVVSYDKGRASVT